MNIKKGICIVIVIILTISMTNPLNVYAVEAGDYVMHELVQTVYNNGDTWTKYYHPTGYPNVWVSFRGNSNAQYADGTTMYIYFYDDETTITAGSATTFSKEVKYTTVDSIADMEAVLFDGGMYDFATTTSGVVWSQTIMYSAAQDPGYYKQTGESVDSYYYDYYYAKNGYYPETVNVEINYWCDEEIIDTTYKSCIAGDTITFNNVIEKPDEKYSITGIMVNGVEYAMNDTYTIKEDTVITIDMEKETSLDISGLWESVKEITELLRSYFSMDYMSTLSKIFPDARQLISEKLANNAFYTSTTAIMLTLKDLYSADYTDANGFYELGLFNLTLGVPTKEYYMNYGNETIGDWELKVSEEKLTVGGMEVDFGLENVKILNLDWFFDTHYEDGKYTKGVKTTITDPFISAWLWVTFGIWLWKTMPDWLSGDMKTIENLAVSEIRTEAYQAEKEAEKEYRKSYEYFKENESRREEYKQRYKEERRSKK